MNGAAGTSAGFAEEAQDTHEERGHQKWAEYRNEAVYGREVEGAMYDSC